MIRGPQKLPDPNVRWIDPATGRPTREFYQYMKEVDAVLRALIVTADDLETRVVALENP